MAAGNAKYITSTIQNKILGIASTMVVEEFVAEANESFISVVADESCNISGKECHEFSPLFKFVFFLPFLSGC